MTVREMAALVGRRADLLSVGLLTFTVEVRDVRRVFNRVDYLVGPVAGSGEVWVSSDRCTIQAVKAVEVCKMCGGDKLIGQSCGCFDNGGQ